MLREGSRTEEIEAGRARLREAQKELELAELNLSRCKLFAPIAGRVLSKNREAGEMVPPGTSIVTLGDLTRPWLNLYIGERDLGRVSLGMPAQVTVDSFPDQPFPGKVTFISETRRVHAEEHPDARTSASSWSIASRSSWRTATRRSRPACRRTRCCRSITNGSKLIGRRRRQPRPSRPRDRAPRAIDADRTSPSDYPGAPTRCATSASRSQPGELFGLVGPDGAGKTTFLRILAGLLSLTGGTVRIDGIDVSADPAGGEGAHRLHVAALQPVGDADRARRTCSTSPRSGTCRAASAASASPACSSSAASGRSRTA